MGDCSCTETIFICTWVLLTFNQGLVITDFTSNKNVSGFISAMKSSNWKCAYHTGVASFRSVRIVDLTSHDSRLTSTMSTFLNKQTITNCVYESTNKKNSPRWTTSCTTVSLDHICRGILSWWSCRRARAGTVEPFQVLHSALVTGPASTTGTGSET
jgi:hypothetical protein